MTWRWNVTWLLAGAALAQDQSYGRSYAFAERAPRTRLERVVAQALPSVVKVHGASGLATIRPYATGVIVSAEGHILTLDLVMVQQDQTRVVLADGSVYRAKVYPADDKLGVRLLKIDAPGKTLVPLVPATRTDWAPGTFVVSLGNAFRLAEFSEKVSATFGVLTARVRTGLRYRMSDVDYDGELLVTDAPNNPGQYGGPLLTLSGDWIGINTRLVEAVETNTQLSAAIPAWEVRAYIDRLTRGILTEEAGDPGAAPVPVYHGISLFERGIRRSPPAYVDRVARASPARAIGLRPDDLIVRLGEYPVRTCVEFHRVMRRFRPGQTVQVTFKRGTRVLRKAMTLEAAK